MKRIILFYFIRIKSYWKVITVLLFLILFTTVLGLYMPILNKNILDFGILKKDFNYVKNIALIYIGLYFIKCIIEIFTSYLIANLSSKVRYQLYEDIFKYLERFNLSYYIKNDATLIYNNMNSDVNNISKIFDGNLFTIFSQILYFVGGIICIFSINYQLAILGILFVPIKYFSINFFAGKNKELTKQYIDLNGKFANWFHDSLNAIRDIKIYNLYKKKLAEFRSYKYETAGYERKFAVISSFKDQLDIFNTQFLAMAVYVLGVILMIRNELTYGDILAFLSYLIYVTNPVTSISNLKYLFAGIMPSAKRLYEFFQNEQEDYLTGQEKIQITAGSKLVFKNVSFSYGEKLVLKNINLELVMGSVVAIVGDNGSGKSTLTGLLTRFLTPCEGEILLDGTNINKINIDEYRELFSISDSMSHLFECPIMDNIKIIDDHQRAVMDAVIRSELDYSDLIDSNTNLNCKNISSGERQKILIARSFYANKPITIFDEATSNIDKKSKVKIESSIKDSLNGGLVIIITHNIETLKQVDKVIFLSDHTILENGTYEQVMKNNRFKELFARFNQK